jgi:hypothetical protein
VPLDLYSYFDGPERSPLDRSVPRSEESPDGLGHSHNNRDRQSCLGRPYVEQLTQGMGGRGRQLFADISIYPRQLLVGPVADTTV